MTQIRLPRRLATAALLPLALTGAAHAPKDQLEGRVAGKPVDCIDPSFTMNGPTIIDRTTIQYESGRTIYRTTPIGSCASSLDPVSTLIIERFGSQLCRNDRFRVLRPGESIPSPVCRFGQFTPYTKAAK
jgi:hypothetical protein